MPNIEYTRRQIIASGAYGALAASLPGIRFGTTEEKLKKMEPKLVRVPEASDIAKAIAGTAKVGIQAKTHEEHLKLWQGYANKTNEIRKALAAMEADPSKANQIYSEMRALKVNYAFAYGGYINHSVYFDTLGGISRAVRRASSASRASLNCRFSAALRSATSPLS